MTHPFPYGETELGYLSRACPQFAHLVEYYDSTGAPRPARPVEENVFAALMRAINDQLISLKAAATIWGRICALFDLPAPDANIEHSMGACPTPEQFARVTPEELHACGTTSKKAEYMHDIACMVVDGSLDLEGLRTASDEDITRTLVALRGIGLWSAEMLLIHAYERPDVISFGDAAIRRGVCMLFSVPADELSRARFDELTSVFHPYATTASIYLWRLSKETCWPPDSK